MLTESQLEKTIQWLQKHGSPPVIYLTHLNLLKDDPETHHMQQLWRDTQRSKTSQEIFNKQRKDGSWCDGGSWAYKPSYQPKQGYTPVSPKYVTTAGILAKLGEMGYTVKDLRVRQASEWILDWQWENGVLSEDKEAPQALREDPGAPNNPCRMSIQLEALAKTGMGTDQRLRKSWKLMIKWRRDDNGWLQDGHLDGSVSPYKAWDRSCPWVTYFATSAFFHSGIKEYKLITRESLGFLLWHMSQKNSEDLKRFFWHGHEPIKELLMFSMAGFDPSHKVIAGLLAWLMSMYNPDKACFRYTGKPYTKMTRSRDGATSRVMKYRMYHQAEDDWLTYYASMIFSNFLRNFKLERMEH